MNTNALTQRKSPRRWMNFGLSLLVLLQIAILIAWDHVPDKQPSTQDLSFTPTAHRVEALAIEEPIFPPQIVDVGYLSPGEVTSLELPFVSPFDECTKVLNCATTCGCLKVQAHPEELSPEADAVVTVQLDVPERIGYYAQRVKIVTDHHVQDTIEVVLNARIGLPLRSEPTELVITGHDGQSGQAEFEVWNDGPEPVKLLYATSSFGTVQVPPEPIEPGAAMAMRLEWSIGNIPPPEFDITIRTACANQRSITVAVRAP